MKIHVKLKTKIYNESLNTFLKLWFLTKGKTTIKLEHFRNKITSK